MLGDSIAKGITIGAKTTIKTPDGSRVISIAAKVVDEGIALGMQVEKDGKKTDYIATFDATAVFTLLGFLKKPRINTPPPQAPPSTGAAGVEGEEKGYVP